MTNTIVVEHLASYHWIGFGSQSYDRVSSEMILLKYQNRKNILGI